MVRGLGRGVGGIIYMHARRDSRWCVGGWGDDRGVVERRYSMPACKDKIADGGGWGGVGV